MHAVYSREVTAFRACIYRAGTSKGIFLHMNDLPQDAQTRDKVILAMFGSPDKRQIDGLGGAQVLTSKLALVGPSSVPGADVDYIFGQVDIDHAYISYSGLCGNISAGIGPFAIEEGLVRAVEPVTKVRIYSKNTDQIYVAEVPVNDGHPVIGGDYAVAGVPGTGAKLNIDMAGCVASCRMGLLPTGRPKDVWTVPGYGPLEGSMVDAVNPCIFVRAKDLGLKGTERKSGDLSEEQAHLLEEIRKIGFEILHKKYNPLDAVPFVAFVSEPKDYTDYLTGRNISGKDIDFLSRVWFLGQIHQTYPGSISCCSGAAAVIPGTVVSDIRGMQPRANVRIGHPGGIIEVEAVCGQHEDGSPKIERLSYGRTARRIMDGYCYVPNNRFME